MADFNQGLFNEMFKKKYDILQQHANQEQEVAQMQHGTGGSEDRRNLAQERVAGMQYGVGGSSDRSNIAQLTAQGMQYGPGGQGDRSNIAQLTAQGMQYGPGGQGDRNIVAQRPAVIAGANLQNAQARGLNIQSDVAQPNMKLATQRDRLGLLKSSMDNSSVINTGIRQGNLERGTRNPELVSFGDQEDWQSGPALANPLPSVLQQIYSEQMRPKDKPRQKWTGLFPPSDY
jgi:hypothetical protein